MRTIAKLTMAGAAFALAGPGVAVAAERQVVVEVRDEFAPAKTKDASAYTYSPALVPPGARVTVRSVSVRGKGNTATLSVSGLLPGEHYMAHVHMKRCGADPDSSGGHYQHKVGGPVDAENEVWFHVRTDENGTASASATHNWTYAPGRLPGSVVVHAPGVHQGSPPKAACVSVPFAP